MNTIEKLRKIQRNSYPCRFETPDGTLILEIQYVLKNEGEREIDSKYIRFAVTTDGWDLLIDANLKSDSIMQREVGDIDALGITLADLLKAENVPL